MSVTLPIVISVFLIVFLTLFKWARSHIRLFKMGHKIPGPQLHPVFGHYKILANAGSEGILRVFKNWAREERAKGNSIMKFYALGRLFVWPLNGKGVAKIIDSTTELTKGDGYKYFEPWLGGGLFLESGGERWRSHRKMLTPAFHFAKLEGYFDVFNQESKILVDCLETFANSGDTVDLFPFIKRCALDVICGTAMGVNLGSQFEHEHEYVKSVEGFNKLGLVYAFNPLYKNTAIFYLMGYKSKYDAFLEKLKGFTEQIIKDRKLAIESGESEKEVSKRKMNFLDLLLNMEESNELSEEDIRQEVDTFMFAGHDTTTASTSWLCWNLAHNPEVQEKAYEEIVEVLGENPNTDISFENLNKLNYLDRVVKESKRRVAPVSLFQRKLQKDLVIDGYTIPAGANVTISPTVLHDNPLVFKNPEIFNPDRFLPEETSKRHPYDYIPFSAGLRNCIGQKFSQLEEKVIISHLIRNFKLKPMLGYDETIPCIEAVTKPSRGIPVKLIRRN